MYVCNYVCVYLLVYKYVIGMGDIFSKLPTKTLLWKGTYFSEWKPRDDIKMFYERSLIKNNQ